MKLLIIDSYYPSFLRTFWQEHKDLQQQPYNKKLKGILSQCFGTADFYSHNLRELGHDVEDFILNDISLCSSWAQENNLRISTLNIIDKIKMFPATHRFIGRPKIIQDIVMAKITASRPDVLYLQDLSLLNSKTLEKAKNHCHLIVGQIASPLPGTGNLKQLDLILTSFPHFVTKFRQMGIHSEYLKLCFEPRILKKIKHRKRIYDVTFVGSISPDHHKGTQLLEEISKEVPLGFWGNGEKYLPPGSPLRKCYRGEAWGIDMYQILSQSKILINRHISTAENYANNMRLYESTGMGAMLITDEKSNLNKLFRINKEVVTYKNAEELVSKIKYYLSHEKEREKIATAGQKRTLKEHNYLLRMKELIRLTKKYMKS